MDLDGIHGLIPVSNKIKTSIKVLSGLFDIIDAPHHFRTKMEWMISISV
jgi:hypothetical protein